MCFFFVALVVSSCVPYSCCPPLYKEPSAYVVLVYQLQFKFVCNQKLQFCYSKVKSKDHLILNSLHYWSSATRIHRFLALSPFGEEVLGDCTWINVVLSIATQYLVLKAMQFLQIRWIISTRTSVHEMLYITYWYPWLWCQSSLVDLILCLMHLYISIQDKEYTLAS